MNNLSLESRCWNAFFIEDVAEIVSGRDIYEKERWDGLVPYITATANNNGIGYFVANNNDTLERGCLSVNRNGSVGYCFYHPYEALYGNDTRKLRLKRNNRYVALFISLCITKQREKYGYGYKMGTGRLKRQRILLPVDASDNPDWAFMEAYMKQKEKQILKPTIERLCKQLIINDILGGGKTLYSNWKEFVFGEEFSIQSTNSGIDKNKLNQKDGVIPYITRSDLNNGMDMFVTEQSLRYKVDEGNVITIGLDTQTVFYQPTSFYTGQNIQIIRHAKLDRYNAMFLIVAIKKLVEKFSWGSYGATLTRLRKSRVYLPATDNGEIDFAFMSSFMKEVEHNILNTTLKVFKDRISINKSKMGGVKWKNFLLCELFPTLVAGKSKGLNHIEKSDNGISYLGATNQNNGVLCFVNRDEKTIQTGNCIAFIRNGEGSMGYSVYKAEDFIATSDMTLGYNKHLNKYIGTFITTIADRVRGKYNFGYKRSANRLSKEIITLPVDNNGFPDWKYMENYMRNIESKQILSYLKMIRNGFSQI
ncbi:restriction endonuclease subunit S [Bacteroides clarus]